MKKLGDILLTIVVLGGILVVSAVFTSWFTRKMYYKCEECSALNAKRRTLCRMCGHALLMIGDDN
jgi:rRNA maturation endonuclease Nob1